MVGMAMGLDGVDRMDRMDRMERVILLVAQYTL